MMAIEEIIDQLYGLPLAEFTGARNKAARELREEGQRDAAELVKGLRKPTSAAAAVNRLVREHRGEVEQFLRAAVRLRDAQLAGEGDLAAATKREHEELERLIRMGGEAVRQTLLAAAADEDAARQLLAARLERELELPGFGTLLTQVRPAGAKPQLKPAVPEKKQPDDRAARARLENARAELSAAEAEELRARDCWDQTRKDLRDARASVEKAQRELDELQGH